MRATKIRFGVKALDLPQLGKVLAVFKIRNDNFLLFGWLGQATVKQKMLSIDDIVTSTNRIASKARLIFVIDSLAISLGSSTILVINKKEAFCHPQLSTTDLFSCQVTKDYLFIRNSERQIIRIKRSSLKRYAETSRPSEIKLELAIHSKVEAFYVNPKDNTIFFFAKSRVKGQMRLFHEGKLLMETCPITQEPLFLRALNKIILISWRLFGNTTIAGHLFDSSKSHAGLCLLAVYSSRGDALSCVQLEGDSGGDAVDIEIWRRPAVYIILLARRRSLHLLTLRNNSIVAHLCEVKLPVVVSSIVGMSQVRRRLTYSSVVVCTNDSLVKLRMQL